MEGCYVKIPTTFQLAGVTWQVKQQPGFHLLGQCDRDNATILLRTELPKSAKEVAFLHELCHAVKFTMGDGGPHDEKEVDGFAYLLHQAMSSFK